MAGGKPWARGGDHGLIRLIRLIRLGLRKAIQHCFIASLLKRKAFILALFKNDIVVFKKLIKATALQ